MGNAATPRAGVRQPTKRNRRSARLASAGSPGEPAAPRTPVLGAASSASATPRTTPRRSARLEPGAYAEAESGDSDSEPSQSGSDVSDGEQAAAPRGRHDDDASPNEASAQESDAEAASEGDDAPPPPAAQAEAALVDGRVDDLIDQDRWHERVAHFTDNKLATCYFCDWDTNRLSALADHMQCCASQTQDKLDNFNITCRLLRAYGVTNEFKQCDKCYRACVADRHSTHNNRCQGAKPLKHARLPSGPRRFAQLHARAADDSDDGDAAAPAQPCRARFGLDRMFFTAGSVDMRQVLSDLQQLCTPLCANARKSSQHKWRRVTNAMLDEVTAIGNNVIKLNRTVMTSQHLNDLALMGVGLYGIVPGLVQLLQQRGKPGKEVCQKLFKLHEDERAKDIGLARLMFATVVHDAMQLNLLPKWQQAPQSPHRVPSQKAIRKTCGQGYLSKSLTMARERASGQQEVEKPTIEFIKQFVVDKFPAPLESEPALPDIDAMPDMDQRGNIAWSDNDELRAEEQQMYGEASVVLDEETLEKALSSLSWESSPGVSCVSARMLRNTYQGHSSLVETLLPFANMVVAGRLSSEVMRTWLTGRLCLLPKKGNAWRPLGIGSALLRLINKAVMLKVVEQASEFLGDMQWAVGVSDAGVILASIAQAMYDRGVCLLNTDSKNAYNTMSRHRILSSLQENCPSLCRWFMTCYHQPTPLWLSDGMIVGECSTGVLQGDPLSTLYYCFGFHACLKSASTIVKNHEPDDYAHASVAKTMAYADDAWFAGDGVALLDSVDELAQCFLLEGSTELEPSKSQLLVGKGHSDEELAAIRQKAEEVNVPVHADGITVMGIPVGNEQFIQATLQRLVDKYVHDLSVLEPFTMQQRFVCISRCINARPKFLQRYFQHNTSKEQFERFDEAVSKAMLVLAKVPEDEFSQVEATADRLRSLPVSLAGCGVMKHSDPCEQRYAVNVANQRMCLYLTERHPELVAAVRESRWVGRGAHKVIVSDPDWPETAPGAKLVEKCLGGRTLGDIHEIHIKTMVCDIAPDPTTTMADFARDQATQRMHGRLINHSRALKAARGNHFNNQLVAQALSASTVGSGRCFNWFPVPGYTIIDESFLSLLKMRLCIADWSAITHGVCDCAQRVIGSIEFEDDVDHVHGAPVSEQPLHGLCCRKTSCAGRVKRRHDEVKAKLMWQLSQVDGMEVKVEERMRQGSAHRADLAIRYKGVLHYVDVQVTCPATFAQVNEGSHLVQGTAADRAYRRKLAKYAPVLGGVHNSDGQLESVQQFQPFIVETGGLVHRKSASWLETLLVDAPRALAKCFSVITETLDRHHGKMLSMFKASVL